MAESVDALVSNTCGRKAVPVRPRLWVQALMLRHQGFVVNRTIRVKNILLLGGFLLFFRCC